MSSNVKVIGGRAITAPEAIELRQIVFGSAAAPPRGEWTRTALKFASPKEDISYGLRCPKNSTRGLQSVVQAFILKNLLFDRRNSNKTASVEELLKLQEIQQNESILTAISEILWNVGEKMSATLVLPSENQYIPHSHNYFQDSVTERLHIFEFNKLEDLQILIKRFLKYFMEDQGPGALLLLYSAVMTRTTTKTQTDLDAFKGAHLMGPNEEGSLNIVTLLLTGRATPYLHNGVVYVGDEDHYALPQFGILARSVVGLFVYEGEGALLQAKQPGSRLKTPALPIWVTSCCGHFGVLFNSNRELLRNYHAEKRFELHYYSCAGCHLTMTIDNRTQSNADGYNMESLSFTTREDLMPTPLERLIYTKWEEAKIVFHGPLPAVLNFTN